MTSLDTLRAVRQLRGAAMLEGISLLILVLVAMPLKYALGMPIAVRVVGSVHGLLFLVFLSALVRTATERKWPARRSILALVSAMIPGGTLIFDRELRREIQAG